MTGKIYIKGNLYLTGVVSTSLFSEDGLDIHVINNVTLISSIDDVVLKDDDVFIENIFDKFKVRNITAFSNLTEFEEPITIVDKPVMDKCVMCGKETVYPINLNIEYREHYVDGCGQLCIECYNNTSTI